MDPLLTVAIWALGVIAMAIGAWIQDRREQRSISDIEEDMRKRFNRNLEDLETVMIDKFGEVAKKLNAELTELDLRLKALEGPKH